VGFGPNIITNAADRLETGIGNWYPLPVEPTAGFVWAGDKADIFTDLYLQTITGNLAKDFFTALTLNALYQTEFDYYWPSTSPDGSVDYVILSDTALGPSAAFGSAIKNTWRHLLNNTTVDPAFDNNTRRIRFSLFALYHGTYHVYIKNLSIRKYTAAKTDHLPLMGVH